MATLHMPKGPLRPSNSTICPRTAPKRPPKAPILVHIGCRQPRTKSRTYLGLRTSKRDFEHMEYTRNHPVLVVNQRLTHDLGLVCCGKRQGVA